MVRNGILYLLDANVIIHAHDYYYHMDRVPEFWSWLTFHAENGSIKMPFETMIEVKGGKEAMHAEWLRSREIKDLLQLDEDLDADRLNLVIENGYADDLTDVEIEKIGADPALISYALGDKNSRIVISNEVSKPSTQRTNKRIPDVCNIFGITCHNVYHLIKALDFSTNWNSRV